MRRISFSTNGCDERVRQHVVGDERDDPLLAAASPISAFASACAAASGVPSKPLPGAIRLPTIRPSASATTVIAKK